ncbi:MAG: type I restriction-modification enzyme R subunit C-terminal domain-containing protein [Pseudomonadota bacterium]
MRRHFTENLFMEKHDLDYLSISTREGAYWRKLNRVFGGELEEIISEINIAIAA